jgi:proline iminopeptidase
MAVTTPDGILERGAAGRGTRHWLSAVGTDRRLGAAVAIAVGAALALASSIPMPRGPVTAGQALVVIATSLLAGMAVGYLMRSRWALVLAPLAYVVAYELARLGIAGASVGPIRLDSVFGILALVLGRGVHGLFALLPMALGVGIGLGLAAPRRRRAWIPAGVLVGLLVAQSVIIALPASTPPVIGTDGEPVPGSIAELSTVELNGLPQAVSVRAANPDNPVLLYLSGGPGQSDIGFARALLEPLTADFVVVVWDQRGSGKSYPALEPTTTYTLGALVNDTVALAEHLRERFDEQRIYLLGESWGSTLGVLAVQARPDLFHAYIGSGQMVSQQVTDRIIWRDLLAYAERAGDWALYDQVLTFGEPPYRDTPWAYTQVMGWYPLIEEPYTPPAAYLERGMASGVGPFGFGAQEYTFIENINVLRGLLDMFSIMYPQIQQVDFRADVPSLEVPVWILDGEHELRGRRDLAHDWYAMLDAPSKALVTYPDAGHAVAFEQVDAFRALLVEEILPATYGR